METGLRIQHRLHFSRKYLSSGSDSKDNMHVFSRRTLGQPRIHFWNKFLNQGWWEDQGYRQYKRHNHHTKRTSRLTASVQIWALIMQLEYKLGHDSKVTSASPDCPEQVLVLRVGSDKNISGAGDQCHLDEVVDDEPVLAAKPPETAA